MMMMIFKKKKKKNKMKKKRKTRKSRKNKIINICIISIYKYITKWEREKGVRAVVDVSTKWTIRVAINPRLYYQMHTPAGTCSSSSSHMGPCPGYNEGPPPRVMASLFFSFIRKKYGKIEKKKKRNGTK